MTSDMYIIAVRWLGPQVLPERVDARLSAFGPWFRFNASTWLVATDTSIGELRNALRLTLTDSDSFVVLRVDPTDRQGYAPQDFWQWLDSNSTPKNKLAQFPYRVG